MNVAILCDTTLDSNDGVQQYIKNLGRWLIANGHQVDFLVGESRDEGEFKGRIYSLARNIKLWGNSNIISTSLIPNFDLINQVVKKDYDIVHVQAPYSPLMAQIVLSRLKCKKVATIHTSIPSKSLISLFFKYIYYLQKNSLKSIDQFIAVSLEAANFGKKYLRTDSIIVPNMVDLGTFQPLEVRQSNKINLTYLGRLVPRKGVKYLLDAYKIIKQRLPELNIELNIAGDGPEKDSLMKQSSDNQLDVKFLGYIEESNKNHIYNNADICIFPSIEGESFGIVLLEAFACAKPVVAFNNPGYNKVMRNHAPQWLAKNRDVNELAEKILTLINDKNLRISVGQKNLEESKKYDVNTVCNQIMQTYKDILSK